MPKVLKELFGGSFDSLIKDSALDRFIDFVKRVHESFDIKFVDIAEELTNRFICPDFVHE